MSNLVYNTDGEFGKYIVQELKTPVFSEGFNEFYKTYAKRLLWMDSNNVPGAFQMNTCWWYGPNREQILSNPKSQVGKPHQHAQPEILGFYGSDPSNPYDLGGEVEFFINGESHILTKSTMVFLPPDLPHCPLYVNRVDRPIFHFSVIMNDLYTFSDREFVAK